MLARFFIDRPIFASVLSILITLAGGIAVFTLPIAQYPAVAPPNVSVDCQYPGASAQIVSQTVAEPIEQQVNGVEGMLYMSSQCTVDGSYRLSVTFKPGVDLNVAQVLVQNRVSLAMPQLPDVVRQSGITMRKRSPEMLLTISVNSPGGQYNQLHLGNYVAMHIRDELVRTPGVSEVNIHGQRDYAMRIWVDPEKLAMRNLTVTDVVAAVRDQNLQVAVGQVGQQPVPAGQARQVPLAVQGRLIDADEFAEMVVYASPDGRLVRIKDIGRVELGAQRQDSSNRFNGRTTVGMSISTLSDSNALETGDLVKAKLEELSAEFPEGIRYDIAYDTTPFIRDSIWEVFKALRDAIILVAIVVLIFLRGWRAAIIPLIAVPVAIVGTFAVMAIAGFSINNLTLFGLVLAIGIVVDDAIVVVEAVEHNIERGLAPRAAAIKAMDDVTGPVIAVGVVLSAVFIPCAFVSGIVGQFFRQFALTIAVSTIISMINSLTLSPALASLLLRPDTARKDPLTRFLDFALGWLFRLFERGFHFSTSIYTGIVGKLLRVPALVIVVYAGLLVLTWWSFEQMPRGFIPAQDKGYLMGSVQLPDASSATRTREIVDKVDQIVRETPGVKNVNSFSGNSIVLNAQASNFGSLFIILDDFDKRQSPELRGEGIIAVLRKRCTQEVPEAIVTFSPSAAISGVGRAGGLRLMVEDRGDSGMEALQEQTDRLIEQASKLPALSGLFTIYNANSPQLFVDVDRDMCLAQGISLSDVFATIQAGIGSRYVNDFNRFGRTWQVIVQAEQEFRNDIDDLKKLHVRNGRGAMVPLGAIAQVHEISGPLVLTRYNMYPAATLNGNVTPGYSNGQAIEALEELAARELPVSFATEWTELAFLERNAGSTGMYVFGFSVIFVFLTLSALYESWSLPLAVILVVPLCVLCSLAGVAVAGHDINIFTQIGFVVLIGLASKNAILIVEFAKYRRDEGVDCREATLHACRLRLRPILMTSFAFILGVVPLLIANGAGAEMRRILGTAVFSGMLGVTLFGIFLTPVFFYVIDSISQRKVLSTGPLPRLTALVFDVVTLRFVPQLLGRALMRSDSAAPRR